ncbi:hypothetical protein OQA88_11545 [Cercophora sp. LCS_1]
MEPTRRRRRPALSCSLCRQRKVRCNREKPCNHCSKSDNAVCDYADNGPEHTVPTHSAKSPVLSINNRSSTLVGASETSADSTRSVANTPATIQPDDSVSSTLAPVLTRAAFTGLSDAFYVHYEQESENASAPGLTTAQHIPRCVSHKTRLFGQSHWMSPGIALFRDLVEILERGNISSALTDIHRCKSLARLIKARNSPPWPIVPTRELPSREVADGLVACYLQTTETIYRVLHIPSFQQSYAALWFSGDDSNMGFIIQVKLVMAIGAATYDDEFSLRKSAIHWIHEAMTWSSSPDDFKARLSVQGLQNQILLLIAQGTVGVARDMVYPATGSLLRTAMHMGLHRDPSRLHPKISLHAAEMRRRLWNTIVELTLQSALNTGGPILLSPTDFDTAPPSNYNDADLDSQCTPAPLTTPTETSIPIAFRHTFPQRLAIAKFLNNLPTPSGPYTTTLQLDTALTNAYKTLITTLKSHPPCLAIFYIDLILKRYISALHVPFLEASLSSQTQFTYSRVTALNAALHTWTSTHSTADASCKRFINTGASFLRTGMIQSVFVIAAELRAEILAARESLVPIAARSDLVDVIRQAEEWAWRSVQRGEETNVKGYLFVGLSRVWLEGLAAGETEEVIVQRLVGRAEEVGRRARGVLEGFVGEDGGEKEVGMIGEGGDVSMSDFLFGFEQAESVSWEFA